MTDQPFIEIARIGQAMCDILKVVGAITLMALIVFWVRYILDGDRGDIYIDKK